MDYRNERDALRGRVENLEQELAEAKGALGAQQGGAQAARVAEAREASRGAQPPPQRPEAEELLRMAARLNRLLGGIFAFVGLALLVGGVLTVALGYRFRDGLGLMSMGGLFVVIGGTTFARAHAKANAMFGALLAKEQLAMSGTPMTASLLSAQQTVGTMNMNPQVQAVLEVQGPQGPYQVQTMAVVPQMSIPRFQPGATIQVRVNPMNPHDVAVVF